MVNTTIKISQKVKSKLDSLKKYKRETYNDVIERIIKLRGLVKKWKIKLFLY